MCSFVSTRVYNNSRIVCVVMSVLRINCFRSLQTSKEQQERVRILQNQNRFLNEEVRRLARLRSQEQTKIKEQDGSVIRLLYSS